MADIAKYEWDLGNGVRSSSPTPTTRYSPGKYTVGLTATSDTGDVYTVEEIDFIIVSEDQQNLLHEKYFTDPRSFHYGTRDSVSTGWSENAGDNWIWPESQAAVTHRIINGVDYLLVWDMYDDVQYCINPRETANSSITHLDKDTNEISCSATFPAMIGESHDYQIMHQQTKVQLRNDIDTGTRPVGMSVYMSLLGQDGEVLERVKVQPGREIVFKEQSTYEGGEHDSIQIRFETDKSGYMLTAYESVYKTDDKSITASEGVGEDTAYLVANVSNWLTRTESYLIDLGNGVEQTQVWTYTTGADGRANTAIQLTGSYDIANAGITGTIMFWYKGVQPSIGVALTDVMTKNGFTLTYFAGAVPANITFAITNELFDIRVLPVELDLETVTDYGTHLEDHLGGY